MVVGFIVYSSAIVSAYQIDLIDGDWVNSAPSGNVTITNSGDSGGLSTVRWGQGQGWQWWVDNQSGYDFLSEEAFDAPTDGSAFLLGNFTHQNYPISGSSLSSIDLNLTLGSAFDLLTTFNFTHNETPNTGTDDENRDIVTIENPTLDAILSDLNGTTYYFNLLGFSQDGGDNISNSFNTYEGLRNTAGLYAMITSEPIHNNPVPEPSTVFLLGFGLIGFVGISRKRFKK